MMVKVVHTNLPTIVNSKNIHVTYGSITLIRYIPSHVQREQSLAAKKVFGFSFVAHVTRPMQLIFP